MPIDVRLFATIPKKRDVIMGSSKSINAFQDRLTVHKKSGRCSFRNVIKGTRELCDNKAGAEFCAEHRAKICGVENCTKQATSSIFYGSPVMEHPKCEQHVPYFN